MISLTPRGLRMTVKHLPTTESPFHGAVREPIAGFAAGGPKKYGEK